MELTIHFESSVPRTSVALHAWEPQGKVWDIVQRNEGSRDFQFRLQGPVADQRNVRFKFRFPDEHRWEPEEYVRRIPRCGVQQFWCFDHSPRTMLQPPVQLQAPATKATPVVTVRLLTLQRFAGGQLYGWQPGTEHHVWIRQQSRDERHCLSEFRIPLQPWMVVGFHFKFVDAHGVFEAEACNRVWRPADGDSIFVKSGQATLWTGAPQPKHLSIGLIYPRSLGAPPELSLSDLSGDPYEEVVRALGTPEPPPRDARFSKASYPITVYPEAPYELRLRNVSIEGPIVRPLSVAAEDEPKEWLTVLGDARWVTAFPQEARVSFVFHPRPWTPPLARLSFELSVGNTDAFEHASAQRQPDGTWRAQATVPVGLSLNAVPLANAPLDQRPEGHISTSRRFMLERSEAQELHTVDAQPGFVRREPSAPVLEA